MASTQAELSFEEIRKAAMKLPIEDREKLSIEIVDSVEFESSQIDRSWLDEVKRRIARYERGETELLDHEQVMNEAERDLAAVRGDNIR